MTARTSPHYAAVRRAQVARAGAAHHEEREQLKRAERHLAELEAQLADLVERARWRYDPFGLANSWPYRTPADNPAIHVPPPGYRSLRDEPNTEEQKLTRWQRIWGKRD